MTPLQFARVKELFLQACDIDTGLRGDFLDSACGGDADLRREVESLLDMDREVIAHASRGGEPAPGAAPRRGDEVTTQDALRQAAPSDSTLPVIGGQVPHGSPRGPKSRGPGPIYHGRFLPGTILGDRYRIVALLGEGGMGEVYRADDLKLGQTVALKFLPELLARDAASLERFHDEVRLARQITHPHVCRVYDIGEVEGHHFLSMEYVDGEDLASLLRRIGRFPFDRALEVARQLCAGLAAAHEQGVLHLDLKPANVMIDGRGKVLIHDFGLASLADQIGAGLRAGTPGYMAPEQWAGKPVSAKTDLYSLGLVLYEIFTGKPAIPAESLADAALRKSRPHTPAPPSTVLPGLDPAADLIIQKCLSEDPRQRPESALAVLSQLPGGDPVAAAMAAGKTLSAEMLAATPSAGRLKPVAAFSLLLLCLLALVLNATLCGRLRLLPRLSLPKPPEVLADRARAVVQKLGYALPGASTASGLEYDIQYAGQVPTDKRVRRRDEDADGDPPTEIPPPIYYWYRQSPRALVPAPSGLSFQPTRVTQANPPAEPGMTAVRLDPAGRLIEFTAMPSAVRPADTVATPQAPDDNRNRSALETAEVTDAESLWRRAVEETQLDPVSRAAVAPVWNPPVWCDTRAAWVVRLAEEDKPGTRIEAAALRGKVVWVRVLRPVELRRAGETAASVSALPPPPGWRSVVRSYLGTSVYLGTLIGAAILAHFNLRLGRADRRGTFRLAVFVFLVLLLMWAVAAGHAPAFEQEVMGVALPAIAKALFWAASLWLVYVALEPHARRLWPRRLISWTRVLTGRWRDPLVGRDVLIGCAAGIVAGPCLGMLDQWGQWAFQLPDRIYVSLPPLGPLTGARYVVEAFCNALLAGIHWGLLGLFVPVMFAVLTRRVWLGVLTALVLWTAMGYLSRWENQWWALAWEAMAVAFPLFVILRFGLLAGATMYFSLFLLNDMPITSDLSSWYSGVSTFILLVLMALCGTACFIALGGRRMFSRRREPGEPSHAFPTASLA